jgi:microcystin-dependent protein
MPELINEDKGLDSPAFNTFIPELEEPADIRDALKLLYYGTLENGPIYEVTNSLYGNLINFNTRINQNNDSIVGHVGAIANAHGIGEGSEFVGTIKAQTLTNKTLTSPTITSPTVTGTATLPSTTSIGNVSSTEISYVDGVTSPIQTQLNTNTPVGMISIHAGSSSPTGWLLCDGTSYSTTTYANLYGVIGYTFAGSGESFNVPNLKGRVVVGIDGAQTQFDSSGETGGAMTHQHSSSNSGNTGSHNHTIPSLGTNSGNDTNSGAGAHGHNVPSAHTHPGVDHYHNVNPDNVAISSSGNHTHTTGSGSGSGTSAGPTGNSTVPLASHTHSTPSGGAHSHNVDIPTTASTGPRSGAAPGSFDLGNTGASSAANFTAADAGRHVHTVNTVQGSTSDSVGAHSHSVPESNTLSNLQPYMALNYIIKI